MRLASKSSIIKSSMADQLFQTKKGSLVPWAFLAVAIVSGVVCIFALRANNQHMISLRNDVYAADKNNTDLQKPLRDLQQYVTGHMNTNLSAGDNAVYPPVQLKYTYDRLVQAQGSGAAAANAQIYNDAQKYCEQQNSTDVSGRNRVPCIEAYVQSHTPQSAKPIPDALYKFSFVSPRWSPDVAGLSMALAVVSTIGFVLSLVIRKLFKAIS